MHRMRLLIALLPVLTLGCERSGARNEPGVQLLTVLGGSNGEGALPSMPYVSPQINGYYFVTTPEAPAEEPPRLFDSTGRFIQTIGRHGEGPNEYRRPQFVYRIRDSAWIFDEALHRVTSLVPPDSMGPTHLWQFKPYSLLPLPDGTFVLSRGIWGTGPPLYHVDAGGQQLGVFGDTLPTGTRDWRWVHLASTGDGAFWSAPHYGRLEFQKWGAPGRLVRTLSLDRAYFVEYTKYARQSPSTPPDPQLIGFWSDSTDALWIVVVVPDPKWPEGLGSPAPGEGGTYYPIEDVDKVFDTVIERVDAETGASLASWRIDPAVLRVIEPWILQSIKTDEDGWFQAHIWQVPH